MSCQVSQRAVIFFGREKCKSAIQADKSKLRGFAMVNGAEAGVIAVMAEAAKAFGAIVRLEPADFDALVQKQESPLVVFSQGGFFKKYQYLMGYKGLVFYTKTVTPLNLPLKAEVIRATKIWIPTY
jgi:hypothetical protein